MKKTIAVLVAFVVLLMNIHEVKAADPKILFRLDCNTLEKLVTMGFQTNPEAPSNGVAIVASKFVLLLTPSGNATFDDIKNATIELNPTFSNAILAENAAQNIGTIREIKVTVGFTGGTGSSDAKDLLLIKGVQGKAYQVSVKSAELYPKDSTQNIYKAQNEGFSADPATCQAGIVTPNPATTPIQTTLPATGETSITVSTDKTKANATEPVIVTAIIRNRNGASIDWSQKGGTPIQPEIKNSEEEAGVTKSVFTFTMPESSSDLVLEVTSAAVTRQVIIEKNVAPAENNTVVSTDTGEAKTESLADRLKKRREQLKADQEKKDELTQANLAEPQNIHSAADGLAESGPAETILIILGLSASMTLLWRRYTAKSI